MASKQTQNKIKLRIIGGQLGGRLVPYHGGDFTRPMKDSIRESLFNIIGGRIRGTRCFDLFAGTGALAFESISRGATRAVAVERHRGAAHRIQATAAELEVSSRIEVITGDTFRLFARLLEPPPDDVPWIVFLCPPYALWNDRRTELNRIITVCLENAPPGSVLVAEADRHFDVSHLPTAAWQIRQYGGTTLAIAEPAMVCGMRL